MKKTKKESALLYLGRFQADYLAEGSTQSARFPFAPEVIRDLDVINPQGLIEQIKAFVQQYKIAPSNLIILLSDDLLFSKTITVPDPNTRQDAIKSFIEAVPFEETGVVEIPFQGSVTVSVANKTFYESFKKAFESNGFTIELILPAFLLNKEVNLAKSGDVSSLQLALKRAPSFHQYSLLSQSIQAPLTVQTTPTKKNLLANKRLLLLVGVFGVLIVTLIVVIVITSNANNNISSQTQPSTEVSEVEEPVSVPPPTKVSFSSIAISYPISVSDKVNVLIPLLQNIGITTIASESAHTVSASSSGSTLFLKSDVSENDKTILIQEIHKIFPLVQLGKDDTATREAVLVIRQ